MLITKITSIFAQWKTRFQKINSQNCKKNHVQHNANNKNHVQHKVQIVFIHNCNTQRGYSLFVLKLPQNLALLWKTAKVAIFGNTPTIASKNDFVLVFIEKFHGQVWILIWWKHSLLWGKKEKKLSIRGKIFCVHKIRFEFEVWNWNLPITFADRIIN